MNEEKLKKANILKKEIDELERFIKLLKQSQEIDEKYLKTNELNGVNRFVYCKVSSRICTGTQSPNYEATLEENDLILSFVKNGLFGLEVILKDKKQEFNSIFCSV